MRARTLAALSVVALVGSLALATPSAAASPQPGVALVEVGPDDDRLWPYTSRATDFGTRTLVITTVVHERPDRVRALLEWRTPLDWEPAPATNETGNQSGTATRTDTPSRTETTTDAVASGWTASHGAVRYTYVYPAGASTGEWVAQRYQLHAGTYLGSRAHVRAFAPKGDASWTALQAHGEYWDWFRLRHTVTDVQATAAVVERDLTARHWLSVERRVTAGVGPARAVEVVGPSFAVSSTAALALLVAGGRRRDRLLAGDGPAAGTATLGLLALGAPLALRFGGIGLELALPVVPPKAIAAVCYPLFVVGLPAAVVRARGGPPPVLAAAATSVGFLGGIGADFAFLGVVPPDALLAHRALAAAALGLIAGAETDRSRLVGLLGGVLWALAVVVPLAVRL